MPRTPRPTRAFAVVVAVSSLLIASCSDDDPTDPTAPPVDVTPTPPLQEGGVPLEPGSNLPPTGTNGEDMPDSSGPPATG